MTRLQEIKERCEKATPGPWTGPRYANDSIYAKHHHGTERAVAKTFLQTCCAGNDEVSFPYWENAEFIAHSREDIPWLVSQLEKAIELAKLATMGAVDNAHDVGREFLEQMK